MGIIMKIIKTAQVDNAEEPTEEDLRIKANEYGASFYFLDHTGRDGVYSIYGFIAPRGRESAPAWFTWNKGEWNSARWKGSNNKEKVYIGLQ